MKRNMGKRKKFVASLDEAGRGPLAGPVVSAAAMLKSRKVNIPLEKNKDSKKLSSKKRKEIYRMVVRHPQIKFAIGRVSETIIDEINILEATKLAMERAVRNLEKKLSFTKPKRQKYHISYDRRNHGIIDFLILDGNFKINLPISQKSIIKADEKIFACQIASIIAKVHRDRIMETYHQKYPQYGFDRHKGYPTKYHLRMLRKYGPCKIHRKSFKPIIKLLNG